MVMLVNIYLIHRLQFILIYQEMQAILGAKYKNYNFIENIYILKIKKGAYTFEIGDHGSIIVMAKDKDYASTKYIEYSLDEGKTWSEM